MKNKISLNKIDVSSEVIARIAKAAAKKYDCTVDIDFSNGNQKINYRGKTDVLFHIAEEVADVMNRD
ncbi:hypothetical protein QUF70_01030 [Desulfobacterales bacterium HSG17]|nr:hypothetical protein [Desulfobacterales bacterium HSG17]